MDGVWSEFLLRVEFRKARWRKRSSVSHRIRGGAELLVPTGRGAAVLRPVGGWTRTTGDPEVIIAVLDTGATLGHPDLASVLRTNSGETPGNERDPQCVQLMRKPACQVQWSDALIPLNSRPERVESHQVDHPARSTLRSRHFLGKNCDVIADQKKRILKTVCSTPTTTQVSSRPPLPTRRAQSPSTKRQSGPSTCVHHRPRTCNRSPDRTGTNDPRSPHLDGLGKGFRCRSHRNQAHLLPSSRCTRPTSGLP